MTEIRLVQTLARGLADRIRARSRELGDEGSIVETVIIVGLLAAAAIAIVAIIVSKATSAANNIKTQ